MERTTPLRPTLIHILGENPPPGVNRFIDALGRTIDLIQRRVHPEKATAHLGQGTIAIVHEPMTWRSLWRLVVWRARAPVVLVEHVHSAGYESANVKHIWLFHYFLRLAYACATRVVSVSEGQQRWMRDNDLVGSQKLRQISPWSELEPLLQIPLREPGHLPVFGVFGRFCPQTGIDLLLRATQQIPQEAFEISIAGEGPQEAELKKIARSDRRISWLGPIEDLATFFMGCDAIVLPARWEAFGLTCLEAKAAGRPVIVHAIDGLTEQAQGCGLAVAAEPGVLAAALVSLSQLPSESWGEVARTSARESVEKSTQGWKALIDELTPLALRKGVALPSSRKSRSAERQWRVDPSRPAARRLPADHRVG